MSKPFLLGLSDWKVCESGQGGTLTVQNGMKLHIHDQATWMEWKDDPVTRVPHCILQYLRGKEGDDMELRCPEETYITGESVIVEDIDKSGARILITKQMQSELAFAVTSMDVVAFRQTDFILQGQSYEHTQYCCDLPDNFMANMLYPIIPQIPPGNTRSIGDMVAYHPELKEATLITTKVFRNAHRERSPFKSVTVQCLAGELTIFCGKGFQTSDMLGVVM